MNPIKKRETTIEGIVTLLIGITSIMAITNFINITNIPWEWVLAPLWLPVLILSLALIVLKLLD